MLNITTMKNYLNQEKSPYCFRSSVEQTLSTEQLINEIVKYNSTLTDADVRACLSVLDSKVREYVNKGYSVELPFAYLNLNAKGTCNKPTDSFVNGMNNNKIGVKVVLKNDAIADMTNNVEYKHLSTGYIMDPKITGVFSILQDGTKSNDLSFAAGDIIEICGKNLTIDYDDEKQGVFFESETDSIRASKYSRSGTNVIDTVIPNVISQGRDHLTIRTKPGVERYAEHKVLNAISVA